MWFCVCLWVWVTVCLYISVSTSLCVSGCPYLSALCQCVTIYHYAHLCFGMYANMCACLGVCLHVSVSLCLCLWVSVCLCLCLPLSPSFYLCVNGCVIVCRIWWIHNVHVFVVVVLWYSDTSCLLWESIVIHCLYPTVPKPFVEVSLMTRIHEHSELMQIK